MPFSLKTVRSVYKFEQQLVLECTKLMKVAIFLELVLDTYDQSTTSAFWYNRRPGYFFMLGFQPTKVEVQAYWGWGESVILVRHNLSIKPPAEHNFGHNG